MNIAILIPELGGGGAERVAQRIGDYYIERGYGVYYFLANMNVKQDYPVKGEIVRTGIKCCMSDETSDLERIFGLFCASLEMRRLKARYKIDVAVSFMEEFNYLNILSKGKEKVITRVCTILSKREDLQGFLYKRRVIRFFYSNADKVIVMSRYAVKDMHDYYKVPLRKLRKIPNPVTGFPVCDNEPAWQYGRNAVVCVGRLEPVKQHERIIRAFSYVCKSESDAKLIILGKGPQLSYLRKICKKYQISDNVLFEGFTDNIAYYLKYARLFVMASVAEGFPNSMIEAMSYGVPIITTDSPGACGEIVGKPENAGAIESMIFCKYGILTPDMPHEKIKSGSLLTEQEVILGDTILKVLKEDELYNKYKMRSLKRAEMYSISRIMEKWNHIVNGVTVQPGRKGKME